jgi:hypothetical protein
MPASLDDARTAVLERLTKEAPRASGDVVRNLAIAYGILTDKRILIDSDPTRVDRS